MADHYAEGLRAARELRTHCEELKRGLNFAEGAMMIAQGIGRNGGPAICDADLAAWERLIAVGRAELSRSLERLHEFDGEVE